MLANYRLLLADRTFVAYSMTIGFIFFGLFAYTANSAFVFRDMLGLAADEFGWLALLNVAAYVLGTLLSRSLSRTRSLGWVLSAGCITMATGGLALLAFTLSGWVNVTSIIGGAMIYLAGAGLALPNGFAGALGPYPRIAGAASALVGFAQMGTGAVGTILVAAIGDGSARPLGIVMACAGLATLACAVTVVRQRTQPA